MFNFFKDNKNSENNSINNEDLLTKTASLLIHAAKIDENYSDKEKEIIKKVILELGAKNSEMEEMMINAEKIESNSNQILDFTKKIKNAEENYKVKIIEALWVIIYSDKEADIYETNLMRRLSGLLYLDNKVMGDIKEKIKKKLIK
jgi:uncharacterized tellurite resistance protein B-like protein